MYLKKKQKKKVKKKKKKKCDRAGIRTHDLRVKPKSHIHGFGPGRATVHPDLSNRGVSA